MEYIQLELGIESNEISEILIAELSELGYEGFYEEDKSLHAYIPVKLYDEKATRELLLAGIFKNFKIQYKIEVIPDKNWNELWESGYDPVLIDDICMIRAEFHSPKPVKHTIIIEPKMSFGTGHHETTRLMIRQINNIPVSEKVVLDMGCGTGVLGIFALLKGAGLVSAIDIDEWSCTNSRENFMRNVPDGKFEIIHGNAGSIPQHKYDIVLANINRNILLEDIPLYCDHLHPNGLLIVSGILDMDKTVILEKGSSSGLSFLEEMDENNWISIKFRLSN